MRMRILIAATLLACLLLPALRGYCEDAKPAKEKENEDIIFGHPEWPHPNDSEESVVQLVEDAGKCEEPDLRAGLLYNVGECIASKRRAIRQSIVDWAQKALIGYLQNDYSFTVRKTCPEALSKTCKGDIVADRIAFLKDLKKRGKRRSETDQQVKKAVPGQFERAKKALLKGLSGDGKNEVREQCAAFLPDISADSEVVAALGKALTRDKWSIVRSTAVDSLVTLGNPKCIPALRTALDKDSYSTVRSEAAEALLMFEDKTSLPLFKKGLRDGWSSVRVICIDGVARFGDIESVKLLPGMLSDRKAVVRDKAAAALGERGDASFLPALAEVMDDEYLEVRRSACNAIAAIAARHREAADRTANILAGKGLSDKEFEVRIASIDGLLKLADDRGLKALLKAVREENEFRAVAVIDAGIEHSVRDTEFLSELRNLISSKETPPILRKKAAETLEILTREKKKASGD